MYLEDLIPVLDYGMIEKLLDLFENKVNIHEQNTLILLFQMNTVFQESDNDFKNHVIEELSY
tara:strand:+ start:598 stop:783 length:186 start_codon:yes stop_codon:yes gene_type:complete